MTTNPAAAYPTSAEFRLIRLDGGGWLLQGIGVDEDGSLSVCGYLDDDELRSLRDTITQLLGDAE